MHPRWVLTSAACLPVCLGLDECLTDVYLGGESFSVVETRMDPRALESDEEVIPYTLYPVPYTLYPIPYTLYPIPCTLYPVPYTLYPIFYTLYPVP